MRGRAERGSRERRHEPPGERIATAHLRQAPDFVIIGAQRAGTTSLYHYLTEHPEVGAALRKEVHFFDLHFDRGMDWYLAHFPLQGEATAVGEASPYYLVHPEAPSRMRSAIPHAKCIALLRNPIDRAYSQYRMNVRRGIEPLSFEDAIDHEADRLDGSDGRPGARLAARRSSYVARGHYAEQLERWQRAFPPTQLLVLKSEALFTDPEPVVHRVLSYLGLRRWSPRRYPARHQSSYPDMEPATRQRLAAHYLPHNRRLSDLLDQDFGWDGDP